MMAKRLPNNKNPARRAINRGIRRQQLGGEAAEELPEEGTGGEGGDMPWIFGGTGEQGFGARAAAAVSQAEALDRGDAP